MAAFQKGSIHIKSKSISADNADAGWLRIYAKNDGAIYRKDENGIEYRFIGDVEVASLTGQLSSLTYTASANLQMQISTLAGAASGGIASINHVTNSGGNVDLIGVGGIIITADNGAKTVTISGGSTVDLTPYTLLTATANISSQLVTLTYSASANALAQSNTITYAASANAYTQALNAANTITYSASANALVQANTITYAASANALAQSNTITYAASANALAQSNTITYAASANALAQSNSITYAASANALAQSNTITYAASANALAQSNSNKVTTGPISSSGLTVGSLRLLGRTSGTDGTVEEVKLGPNLSFSGNTLNASVSGSAGGGITWIEKSSNYTAVNNDGIFAITSGAGWTLNLPFPPTLGNTVGIMDAAGTFATKNLTISAGPSLTAKIQGVTGTLVCNVNNAGFTLVYGNIQGWQLLTFLQSV